MILHADVGTGASDAGLGRHPAVRDRIDAPGCHDAQRGVQYGAATILGHLSRAAS